MKTVRWSVIAFLTCLCFAQRGTVIVRPVPLTTF